MRPPAGALGGGSGAGVLAVSQPPRPRRGGGGFGDAVMLTRGARGATTVKANTREAILAATSELLGAMVEENGIGTGDVASAFFTASPDLNAEFPALAARQMGWTHVALLHGHTVAVPE